MAKKSNQVRASRREARAKRLRVLNVVGLVVVVVVTILLLVGVLTGSVRNPSGRRTLAAATAGSAATGAATATQAPGQPWEFDAAGNRYFDPRPGHQHWHSGPPPPEDQRGDAQAMPDPAPVVFQPDQDQ